MKTPCKHLRIWSSRLVLIFLAAQVHALPSSWERVQQFDLTNTGLVKLDLPVTTLSSARPGLEDLRLFDQMGHEIPLLIERPVPMPKTVQEAKSVQVSLRPATTVLILETGMNEAINGVTLATPAPDFIKAVNIEGSADAQSWQPLAEGQPIFREPSGANEGRISFPAGTWPYLRLTVDDQRSRPIPFTGAAVHAAKAELVPSEPMPVTIVERKENLRETRLKLDLGGANLDISSIKVETDDPVLTRSVAMSTLRTDDAGATGEEFLGHGVIYQVMIKGQPFSSELKVPLARKVTSRELTIIIRNNDNQPLHVKAVSVDRRPVYAAFVAEKDGTYFFLTGNKNCAAPQYDLAALRLDLKNTPLTPVKVSNPSANSDYIRPEALPEINSTGSMLDVSAWSYRKSIQLEQGGVQRLTLDLDVLARARGNYSDLRLMQGSRQVPYLLQENSSNLTLPVTISLVNEVKESKTSRWKLQFPRSGLPINQLECIVTTPLFQREMLLYEEVADERGSKYHHVLDQKTWVKRPGTQSDKLYLSPGGIIQGDTLLLETANGDNPAIELKEARAFCPSPGLLFKATPGEPVYLYYGNSRVAAPDYDLALVKADLQRADKSKAVSGPEEMLKKETSKAVGTTVTNGILFWVILALVAVVLLVVIARFLPKVPASK